MLEDRQIVVFFKNAFDVDNVASILVKKFLFLGEVIVIPKNEEKTPLIVFQKGEVKLMIFDDSVHINYLKDFDFEQILEIVGTLENEGFEFKRMGYISNYFFNEEEKNRFIENTLVKDNKRNNHIQLYRFNMDLIDSVKVNVVEIEKTTEEFNIPMITMFDINTPVEDEYNITSSFLESFIKECDRYIRSVINNNIR